MKKALLALAAIATGASAFAQGTILFSNNNIPTGLPEGGVYRAGIFRDNGDQVRGNSTIGAGAGYTVGLFLANNLTTPLVTSAFRTTTSQEVFANTSQEAVVTGVAPGSTANLVIRAWDSAAGSYDAVANGQQRGQQAFTSRALGGPNPVQGDPPFPTPGLTGFTGFEMEVVPEPSTYALIGAGLGALLLRRRK